MIFFEIDFQVQFSTSKIKSHSCHPYSSFPLRIFDYEKNFCYLSFDVSHLSINANVSMSQKTLFRMCIEHITLIFLSDMKIQIRFKKYFEPIVTLNWLSPPTAFKQKPFLFTNWHFRL